MLQEAVAQNHYWRLRDAAGKPPGVLGWWPSHAVTFVEVCCPCCQCEVEVQVARPLGLSPFFTLEWLCLQLNLFCAYLHPMSKCM